MSQNRPKLQRINLPQYPTQVAASSRGIVAGFTGAVNDTVLLWSGVNDAIVPTASPRVTITNDANAGTSVLITRPGIYLARLSLVVGVVGLPTIVAGINVGGAGLTVDPSFTTCVALGRVVIITADDRATITLAASINVVSPGQTVPVRFQASNGAGAAPAANSLVIADAAYSIDRLDIAD